MTTLRDLDPESTLAPTPGWRERIESMESSFKWAQTLGVDAMIAMLQQEEDKAARVATVAARFAHEGFQQSSYKGEWK